VYKMLSLGMESFSLLFGQSGFLIFGIIPCYVGTIVLHICLNFIYALLGVMCYHHHNTVLLQFWVEFYKASLPCKTLFNNLMAQIVSSLHLYFIKNVLFSIFTFVKQ